MRGWLRSDGRKGIRNTVLVAYLVECARHAAERIARPFEDDDVHVVGFPGCYRNDYAYHMMTRLATHPNVGAVLLVSLGCEGFDRSNLRGMIEASGRPVRTLVIQAAGGTRRTVEAGRAWVAETLAAQAGTPPVPMRPRMARMMSLAVLPAGSSPSTVMARVLAAACGRVWVARTCSTSLVPMPKASAPKAPWVEVCESPQTIVMPGIV